MDLERGCENVQKGEETSNNTLILVTTWSYNMLGIFLTVNGITDIDGLDISDIICMVSFAYYIFFNLMWMLQHIQTVNFIFQGQYYINMPLMISLWMNGKTNNNLYLQYATIHMACPYVLYILYFLYEIMK
jgi:hypothetical protein